MRVIGIICEYDPFHSGHQYLIEKARELTGDPNTGILCVMSGDTTQRGTFAQWDKKTRAECALRGGADLIIEIPSVSASVRARDFARNSVLMLSKTGIVTDLCFGMEAERIDDILDLAAEEESDRYREMFQQELKNAQSYAAARQETLKKLKGEKADLLEKPNNTLALEYILAVRETGLKAELHGVHRFGAEHHDTVADATASGSYLRNVLKEKKWSEAQPYLSEDTLRLLQRDAQYGLGPAETNEGEMALFQCKRAAPEDLIRLPDFNEQLARRLYKAIQKANTIQEIFELAGARNLTDARIQRAILHLICGVTEEKTKDTVSYLSILGWTEKGQEMLHLIKKHADIPVITTRQHLSRMEPSVREKILFQDRIHELRQFFCPLISKIDEDRRPVIVERNTPL